MRGVGRNSEKMIWYLVTVLLMLPAMKTQLVFRHRNLVIVPIRWVGSVKKRIGCQQISSIFYEAKYQFKKKKHK